MPPNKQKFADKPDKGKKQLAGIKGKVGNVKNSGVPHPNVVKPVVAPSDAPIARVPKNAVLTDSKKWCLKNTQVLHAFVQKWVVKGRKRVQLSRVVEQARPVNQHKVVDVLKQKVSSTWSAVTYESTAFELTDEIKRTRDWVTTRVTGWVQNAHLDDYVSPYPDAEVVIPHATPNSTDPQQYMTLEIDDEERNFKHIIRHNMCGELTVAYVVKKDIDRVLTDWKAKPGGFFKDRLGMGKDSTLGPGHLKDILDIYFPDAGGGRVVEPYIEVVETVPASINRILLAAPGAPFHASDEFQAKIKTHDLIILVCIDTNTGELIPTFNPGDRNHWVVVTRLLRDGYRVELYNPFPNRRQAYSFGEFAASVGANPQSGWWVKRKKSNVEKPFTPPVFGVAANNPTSSTIDAEQYVFIEGGGIKPKTRLCGQFCTAFIIGSSLGTSLENWKARQKTRPAGLWELTNVLDAYGFNNREGKRSFSIDTLLRYWKKIQPDLYAGTIGGDTNEGTGFLELMSILRAYGYQREDMSLERPGGAPEPFLFAPGRDARPLKKYVLIAGVVINGSTGRLKNKINGGVEHWVVVNSMDPNGNQFGGGGGWVELYNPFPNCWEEYSLREFTNAFNGGTLWVKREITPVFAPETPAPPKVKLKPNLEVKTGKGGKAKGKGVFPVLGVEDIVKEFNLLINQPGAVFGDVIRRLVNRTGLSRSEITRLVGVDKDAGKADVDIGKLLCEHLEVKSVPEAIARWIHEKSSGDETFARQLADTLLRAGILIVNDRDCSLADLENFNFVDTLSSVGAGFLADSMPAGQDHQARLRQAGERITVAAAGRAAKPFVATAVIELKATVGKMAEERAKNQLVDGAKPIHALKPREKYLEWIASLEAASDRLYRVRKWGDPVMSLLGFDINGPDVTEGTVQGVGHFQAVGLYNNLNNEFGAVSNHIDIQREDIDNLLRMQFDEEFNGKLISRKQKMNWLCAFRGNIFMYDDPSDKWETASQIRWGTIALGGNLVQIERFEEIETKLPGEMKKRVHRMGRLVGLRREDWARPLDELLAEGLVHRCFCIYKNNGFGDVPNKGVVFSPLFSPKDWNFNGNKKLDALYIPEVYLEKKGG